MQEIDEDQTFEFDKLIMDELSLFTTKFHTSIQSTVNLYYSTGFLLTETVGFLYGSDETVFMIEGINMVRLQLE